MRDDDQGTTFLAIYHGRTIGTAKLIAVTTHAAIVAEVVRSMLNEPSAPIADNVISQMEGGRKRALRQILANLEADA